MIQDYNGATVVDAAGDKIGTVERSYVDDGGAVQMVSVKLGKLFAKHRLVPTDGLHPDGGTLRIPYPKRLVEAAPEVDADDDVAGDAADRVRLHYDTLRDVPRVSDRDGDDALPEVALQNRSAAPRDTPTTGDEPMPATGIRDEGDVIEVPILEEEVVKRPVVKEVVRLRKETLTRDQPVETTLRREELVVDQRGEADVTFDDDTARTESSSPPPPDVARAELEEPAPSNRDVPRSTRQEDIR